MLKGFFGANFGLLFIMLSIALAIYGRKSENDILAFSLYVASFGLAIMGSFIGFISCVNFLDAFLIWFF